MLRCENLAGNMFKNLSVGRMVTGEMPDSDFVAKDTKKSR